MTAETTWPEKTRDVQNVVMDSTCWDRFEVREGDVYVATFGKCGSTWTEQIVTQLLFDGEPGIEPLRRAGWPEFRLGPPEETLDRLAAQTHRRVLKTHMPVDAVGISPKAKYLNVMRDTRDVAWSFYNHYVSFKPEAIDRFNSLPGRMGPPMEPVTCDVRAFYHDFLDRDGYPAREYWHYIRSWWNVRHLPNVLMVHFNRLKADLASEIERIAAFLEIEIDQSVWPQILEHCSFGYMRSVLGADEMMAVVFKEGGKSFIHKGTNGRWKDVLTAEEALRADRLAAQQLTPDCAHWLKTGEMTG
jgi:aryl sulfotransferase